MFFDDNGDLVVDQSDHAPWHFDVEHDSIQDDTLSDSPTNSVQWRCLVCDSAAYAWLSNSWVCNQCGSNKFYQTNNPATRETADGVWTYMPYGSHVPPPPDGHQASTSANRRRRRRRKHGDSGPGPGGDAWSERGEEETPTEDPSVIPSWHSDHHGSVDRVARTSPTTVTNQRHARKISSSADDATDLRAYNKFCKKVEIWMLQVAPYLSKREAALSLYNALQGEAEQELEHTPVSEIYTDDGVQVILQALKAPMEQKAIYQKRRYLNDFEHIRRYQGETTRSFVNRFRRVQRSLRSVGINIEAAYDNESMGSRLLDRSGLTHEQQRMILVATSQSLLFESVAEALTLQFPEFRGAPPISGGKDGQGKGKNKSMGSTSSSSMPSSSTSSTASSRQSSVSSVRGAPTRRAFVAAHDAGDDQQEDDEFLDTIEEEFEDDQNEPNDDQDDCEEDDGFEDDGEGANDLQELASVLTVTAKKLNNLTLGRKFFTAKQKGNSKGKGGSTRLTPEESKKVTHCTACGARGHWYKDQECPMNKGKGSSSSPKPIEKKGPQPAFKKPHSVNFIHHEHGVVDVYDNPSYGQSFDVNMVLVPSPGIPYVVNEVKFVGSETFAGLIVLDSGCQRTCCGKAWFAAHEQLLHERGLQAVRIPISESFKFGKGAPSTSTTRVYLPSAISGTSFLLGAALLEEDIPFLGSNSLFTSLGAHLHFKNDRMEFDVLGVSVEVQRFAGHMVINILDFIHEQPAHDPVWRSLADESMWHDPNPEFMSCMEPATSQATFADQLDRHAPGTSSMVGLMAACGEPPQEPHDDGASHHLAVGQPRHHASLSTPGVSSGNPCATIDNNMRASSVPKVRQPTRSVCTMPDLRDQVEVESNRGTVGSTWPARVFLALATIASTMFGNHSHFVGSTQVQVPSHGQDSSPTRAAFSTNYKAKAVRELDNLRPYGDGFGPFDGGPALRGVADCPSGQSLGWPSQHHGGAHLPQRGDLQRGQRGLGKDSRRSSLDPPDGAGRVDQSGRPNLRLGQRGAGGVVMKTGTMKQLRGQWLRSSKLLQKEHDVYHAAHDRLNRIRKADLWELFAGEAQCSYLANEYYMNALQPWDLIYGQDLMKRSLQTEAHAVLHKFRPALILMGLDCSHRLEDWEWPQSLQHPLLKLAASLAKQQHAGHRFFLIQNSQNSELWEQPEIKDLGRLPGVWKATCLAGAFHAQVQGKPIRKPFTFLGNLPGLEQALQRTMTKEELDMCVSIQGSMTKPSQAYPEELCRTILAALYEELHRRQPHRFCVCLSSPFEALPVQQPTEDLSQWDPVVDYVEKSFERTAKRPYNIDPKSDMGQTIQGLFRIDAIRIQVVSSPTTRRIPNNVDEYFTRASFLCFNDDTRAVEVEDLDQVRFPRQRFDKPVRLAVFAYGHRRPLDLERVDPSSQPSTSTPTVVPNLPTDIDFPGLTSGIRQEIKASVARLHLNMGHPSREELCRLLAYEGHVPDEVYECARKLRCATCQRLKPPQAPRPSTTPKLLNGQFNDEVQGDIFYCRTLDATTFMVVGFADKATGFHQALVLPDRHANTVFEAFEQLWLRPYGIPLKVMTDPDPSFRGHFQERLQALGCLLEFCPAESHFVIGMIERRNSLLRTILEKLIDTFGINQVDQCSTALVAACHAINSGIHTHGRSAYQAVFGKQPRLIDSNFSNPMVLASSSPIAQLQDSDAGLRAEVVRAEAAKIIQDLDVSQHLRRALLRRTRATKIPDLMPGQPCAFWRWARRGQKKRGTWVIARFLSWDPSHPGKQAWVKTGATSILVTAEQLRAAFGFEQWTPEEADIRALRDASQKFSDHLLRDEQGPPPPDNLMVDDDTIDTNANLDINAELNEPLALTVPSLPQQSQAIQPMSPQPQLEIPHLQPTTMQQTSIQAHHQQQQHNTTINLHTSPE